ncbi:extracellular solute-binding protein [Eubacterium sp. 1001713B170207_170306_E7]|uniref:extracellular solute-binding protein n=1 Tax=Eubacterium sp. 1001713B170207_170306_E7 TaxID=2787097 RepID=UPI00189A4F24|nr:extracellular solute-binding protein [Eubacterium sp. 1001713B170207_170306_E7]
MNKLVKALTAGLLIAATALTAAGCSTASADNRVVIYSNADDEALTAMENALTTGGYEGQYIIQSFATSELGGRMMAEGAKIEADLVTMSTYYLDTAQKESGIFSDLSFDHTTLSGDSPAYSSPITAQEGAIMVNTEVMKAQNLPAPASIKDLANPQYAGQISIPDIEGSSTGWLLVQAVIGAYGETQGAEIMTGIIRNAGPHMESSGSGPFKKVKAGEVALAFGLRHQAVAAKNEGLPIDYIDPSEGSYSLTESIAVINKGNQSNAKAMEMAECIVKNARTELLNTYPLPLYPGETADPVLCTKNPRIFPEALTVDLLQRHQEFSVACKLNK